MVRSLFHMQGSKQSIRVTDLARIRQQHANNMPNSSNTSTISTALDRARRHVSSAMNSLLGPYYQTEDQTEATLNTMRGWLQADNINEEDVLVRPFQS